MDFLVVFLLAFSIGIPIVGIIDAAFHRKNQK